MHAHEHAIAAQKFTVIVLQAGKSGAGDGCFTSGQAHLLPEKIWSCTNDALTAAEDSTGELADNVSNGFGKPIVECHYDNEAKCVVHPNCDWCSTSGKVCFRKCMFAATICACTASFHAMLQCCKRSSVIAFFQHSTANLSNFDALPVCPASAVKQVTCGQSTTVEL